MLVCPRCGTSNIHNPHSLSIHLARYCTGPTLPCNAFTTSTLTSRFGPKLVCRKESFPTFWQKPSLRNRFGMELSQVGKNCFLLFPVWMERLNVFLINYITTLKCGNWRRHSFCLSFPTPRGESSRIVKHILAMWRSWQGQQPTDSRSCWIRWRDLPRIIFYIPTWRTIPGG